MESILITKSFSHAACSYSVDNGSYGHMARVNIFSTMIHTCMVRPPSHCTHMIHAASLNFNHSNEKNNSIHVQLLIIEDRILFSFGSMLNCITIKVSDCIPLICFKLYSGWQRVVSSSKPAFASVTVKKIFFCYNEELVMLLLLQKKMSKHIISVDSDKYYNDNASWGIPPMFI